MPSASEKHHVRDEVRDARVLLVAEDGAAARQVESALAARGYDVRRASLREPDLFSCAIGRQALVFLPAANLLSAQLANDGSADGVDEVLRAARAPGVQLLVAALPEAPSFDALVDAIARAGKPYVIARAPGLMEELAETLQHGERTLWLPRTGRVHISRGGALAEAVASALETEDQGRVGAVPSEGFDVAGLFAAASHALGGQVRVRAVTPLVYRMVRPLARWFKGGEPPPLAFADQLLDRLAARESSAAAR